MFPCIFFFIYENTPLYFEVKTQKVILPYEDAVVD